MGVEFSVFGWLFRFNIFDYYIYFIKQVYFTINYLFIIMESIFGLLRNNN